MAVTAARSPRVGPGSQRRIVCQSCGESYPSALFELCPVCQGAGLVVVHSTGQAAPLKVRAVSQGYCPQLQKSCASQGYQRLQGSFPR
jgi:uncharacterized protein YbaR (Trm112 family)